MGTRTILQIIAAAFSVLAVSGARTVPASASPSCYEVVPMPRKIVGDVRSAPFCLSDCSGIVFLKDYGEAMARNAEFLAEYIRDYTGISLDAEAVADLSGVGKGKIVLAVDASSGIPEEGYSMEVSSDGVVVKGSSPAGVFYGIQTLRKALPGVFSGGGKTELPAVRIDDSPRFGYRGAHFDVCRHFFTVDEVKEYIDMMALHNMNTLHWHITDDQGWRVEIKRYPELVEKGSMRDETLVGHLNDRPEKYDGKPYGGWYTQDEIRGIVEYAAERYIDIVPEVDLPGHMQAALCAYPELGCTDGPYKVWTKWGVSEDVLCAGNDAVLDFLDGVFSEIMELFPSEYIHIGGDECPKTRWEQCPKCQAKAAELGLEDDAASTKEQKLQSYVMKHVTEFLQSHGRKVIGWDEILEGDAADGAVVMSWRGESGGIKAASLGHDVIMTPNTYLYFDYYQGKDVSAEPLSIGGYIPLRSVYYYNPVPSSLSRKEARHILGLQANLWTEYIATFPHVQYMVLPRWAALAENQWACPAAKDYKKFLDRLENLISIYDSEGWNYAGHVFEVTSVIRPDFSRNAISVSYETMGDAPIHYTSDGTVPSPESPVFDGSLEIREDAVLSASAFRNGKPGPVTVDTITFNIATARPVRLLQEPCERYAYDGARMLVDGLKGDNIFGSGRWLGFENTEMEAVIDLGSAVKFSSVTVGACVNTADGVFDARKITVSVSDDGKKFREVAAADLPEIREETKEVRRHFISFPETLARYVKVLAVPEEKVPQWSWLAGIRAFFFCDEIEVGGMVRADAPEVRYIGRTMVSDAGHVDYDWTGTYFTTILNGNRLDAEISVTGESWFNVFADGKFLKKFGISSADTVVTVVSGLDEGRHVVMVQKCTEGEYGKVSVNGFILPHDCGLERPDTASGRHIEFIGNSLTCGFGTEGKDRDEPFKVSTENCNLSYAAIVSRYFGADYTMISHSGQGAVRNYGDSLRVSEICMQERMLRTFDMDTLRWTPSYRPDLVVVNLGSNDFSVPPCPMEEEFVDGYCNLLSQVRTLYGDVPVICVCPPTVSEPLAGYLVKVAERMKGSPVHVIELTKGLYNSTSDLGSVWHPNYSGQIKMAMGLIPYISTVTGWEMEPGRPVE
ncbi:MAG TPA: family 20 glycosylhydrolase [Candidatus Cryptobacteroides intestinipullorum]|nr:family 20 glycosylhydrolase [Candidatus Cryptobacteroides intestinipullorum]